MGYRSTVAYTIRFEIPSYNKPEEKEDPEDAKRSFYTFLAEAKANEDTALCFTDTECFEVDEEKLQFRFFAEEVKWYESYPDVACHEALISLSKSWVDDNNFIGGAFARVGEDTNDNVDEVWGQGEYGWVGINRSVYADWCE